MEQVEVRLPVFEGPLDLLLHLIKENKVDIYDIPILEITEQYLDYLSEWNDMDLEIASEFIVMAAMLIKIKVRKLLPLAEAPEPEEEDDESELIRRLVEYSLFKEAAGNIGPMFDVRHQQVYARAPEPIMGERPQPTVEQLMRSVSPEQLKEIYERLLRSFDESKDDVRAGFKSVRRDNYTVAEKIVSLRKTLKKLKEVSFFELRSESTSKEEEVTYFLAMLELSRMNQVELNQSKLFGDIIARKKSASAEGAGADEQAAEEQGENISEKTAHEG